MKKNVLRLIPYPWLVVGLLCVVGCLNYLDRMMITTMRGSIVEAIPMTDAQFGLLTSVFLWVYGFLSPFAGYIADRFNRSRVIIVSLFIWSLITWLTSYADTFGELLLTRALMGISEACYIPAALALIADYHKGQTRSLATGIHMAGVMVGQSLGFVGGWMAESHSWNYVFAFFGGFGIIYALIVSFVLKDKPSEVYPPTNKVDVLPSVSFKNAVSALFSNRNYILALMYWGLLGIISWLLAGWLPTYYKEQFNLSQSEAGIFATGYFHAASFVGVLVGGFLADRWSRKNKRARILLPAIGLLLAAPIVFIASTTAVLYLAVFCFMIYAFNRAFTDANMMPVLCLIIDERYRATGYGILNFFSCIVGGIGLYAGGVLRDADVNLGLLFQIAVGIMILCSFLLFKIKPTINEQES